MKLNKSIQVIIDYYKRDLAKNISHSVTWLGLLFMLARFWESTQTNHWALFILEIIIALAYPVVFMITVFKSSKKKQILEELNILDQNTNNILNQDNSQQFLSAITYIKRNNKMISNIKSGLVTLTVHQNYQFTRRVFESILKAVVKEDCHYITLSSQSFWGKEPWHNDSSRAEFIKLNVEQAKQNKYIRRIIVINEQLLLPETQLRKAYADKEKLAEVLKDRETLKKIVSDFRTSEAMNFTKYNDRMINLFYLAPPKELEKLAPVLATVLVLNKELNEIMLVKTQNLSPSDKNAQIEGIFGKIKGGIKNKPAEMYNTTQLLDDLLDEFKFKRITFPRIEGKDIFADSKDFITAYATIFNYLDVNKATNDFKKKTNMLTIMDIARILGI